MPSIQKDVPFRYKNSDLKYNAVMHPAVHKYFYYLHKSEMFNKDRSAYLSLEKKGQVKSKALLEELVEKYEIPKHALGDFIYILHRDKTDPFINYELGITREDEMRSFHVKGPAITLTIKSGLTRPQFESLWHAVNEAQVWEVKAMGLLSELGEPFAPIIFDKPKDFDLAFAMYQERKQDPKPTFKQLAEKYKEELLSQQGEDHVKKRCYAIRDLIADMKSTNQPGGAE